MQGEGKIRVTQCFLFNSHRTFNWYFLFLQKFCSFLERLGEPKVNQFLSYTAPLVIYVFASHVDNRIHVNFVEIDSFKYEEYTNSMQRF